MTIFTHACARLFKKWLQKSILSKQVHAICASVYNPYEKWIYTCNFTWTCIVKCLAISETYQSLSDNHLDPSVLCLQSKSTKFHQCRWSPPWFFRAFCGSPVQCYPHPLRFPLEDMACLVTYSYLLKDVLELRF